MEWLKELGLEDELIGKIKSELPKHFIPKEQYNKKVEEVNTFKSKLDETTTQLTSISDKYKDYDTLSDKVKTLSSDLDTVKKEADSKVNGLKKSYILEKELLKNKAVNDSVDLLLKEFDLDKLELTEDGIKDIDKLIEPIKTKRPSLFYTEKVDGLEPKGTKSDKSSNLEDDKLKKIFGVR